MKLDDLKDRIESLANVVLFDYKSKPCGIDPMNHSHYDMWYGDELIIAKSIEEVMTVKLFDNQSLTDIYDNIENLED